MANDYLNSNTLKGLLLGVVISVTLTTLFSFSKSDEHKKLSLKTIENEHLKRIQEIKNEELQILKQISESRKNFAKKKEEFEQKLNKLELTYKEESVKRKNALNIEMMLPWKSIKSAMKSMRKLFLFPLQKMVQN